MIMTRKRRSNYLRKADSRFLDTCVKNLSSYPTGICEEGKKRVDWLKANKNAAPEEELKAPGCPYGIKTTPEHSYCMFKFLSSDKNSYQNNTTQNNNHGLMNYSEIAEATGMTIDQVVRAEMSAVSKLKAIPEIYELYMASIEERMNEKIGYFECNSSMDGFYLDLRDFDVESLMELGEEGIFTSSNNIEPINITSTV